MTDPTVPDQTIPGEDLGAWEARPGVQERPGYLHFSPASLVSSETSQVRDTLGKPRACPRGPHSGFAGSGTPPGREPAGATPPGPLARARPAGGRAAGRGSDHRRRRQRSPPSVGRSREAGCPRGRAPGPPAGASPAFPPRRAHQGSVPLRRGLHRAKDPVAALQARPGVQHALPRPVRPSLSPARGEARVPGRDRPAGSRPQTRRSRPGQPRVLPGSRRPLAGVRSARGRRMPTAPAPDCPRARARTRRASGRRRRKTHLGAGRPWRRAPGSLRGPAARRSAPTPPAAARPAPGPQPAARSCRPPLPRSRAQRFVAAPGRAPVITPRGLPSPPGRRGAGKGPRAPADLVGRAARIRVRSAFCPGDRRLGDAPAGFCRLPEQRSAGLRRQAGHRTHGYPRPPRTFRRCAGEQDTQSPGPKALLSGGEVRPKGRHALTWELLFAESNELGKHSR